MIQTAPEMPPRTPTVLWQTRRAINTIVDGRINTLIDLIDLFTQYAGVVVIMIAGQMIKDRIKHANNFRRLIINDAFFCLSQSTGTVTRPS